jgi:predicted flap endonuclease-1-like 5' DNA nuclease
MSYLITQLWVCLLIAAAIGAFFGYWFAKSSCRKKLDELDARWQRKLDDSVNKHTDNLSDSSTAAAIPVPATNIDEPAVATPIAPVKDQSSYDVEEVEGIGKSYGKKLRDMGISTTEQLLNKCCNLDGRITVAEQIGIEDFVVHKWASMSDLMRISGIEGQYSELMVYAGIDSVQVLAQQNADSLYSKLSSANDQQNRVKSVPEASSLELMINQAKSLNEIMQDS